MTVSEHELPDWAGEVTEHMKTMFACDTARISSPVGTHFLVLGWRKNTRENENSQWMRSDPDGTTERMDFDYIDEKVVASGRTKDELITSAEEYKALLDGGWREFFRRNGIPVTAEMEAAIVAKEAADA